MSDGSGSKAQQTPGLRYSEDPGSNGEATPDPALRRTSDPASAQPERREDGVLRHLSFNAAQRRVLTLLLALLIAYGAFRYLRNPVYIADPQPPTGDRSDELANRLDPNTATAAELTAIPGLGAARAAKIVERRETVLRRDPTTVPFRSPDDLFYVERFGRSMVEQAKPYLIFPATQNSRDNDRTMP